MYLVTGGRSVVFIIRDGLEYVKHKFSDTAKGVQGKLGVVDGRRRGRGVGRCRRGVGRLCPLFTQGDFDRRGYGISGSGRDDSHGSHFISHIRIFTLSNPNFSL